MRYHVRHASTLDLQKLEHFVRVAELGSVTKAAAALNIAQSALSRQIRELELEFGDRLFHRTGRGVLPTRFAEKVLPRVRTLLACAEQLAEDIRANQGSAEGQVTLAILTSLSSIVLTPLLTRISDLFPGIKMHVREGLTDHVEEWLTAGRVDLGILYGDRRTPNAADELLMSAQLYLLSAPDDGLTSAPTFALSGVAGLPMILPGLPNQWRLSIERACADNHVPLSVTYELDSMQTIKDLVAQGQRYSILPLHAMQREVLSGALRVSRIVEPVIIRDVLLAASTQRPRSRASSEVARVIRDVIKELVEKQVLPGSL